MSIDTPDDILYDTLYSLVAENDLQSVLAALAKVCHETANNNGQNDVAWTQAGQFLKAAADGARQLKI